MERILEDLLRIPVYIINGHKNPESGDVTWKIRVLAHVEPTMEQTSVTGYIDEFTEVHFKQYPQVEFFITVSQSLINGIERLTPRNLSVKDWLSDEIREQREQQYINERNALRSGLANTIYGLWRKALSTPPADSEQESE